MQTTADDFLIEESESEEVPVEENEPDLDTYLPNV